MNRIPVDIHLQDDRDKCGQACAQMVARTLTTQLRKQTEFSSGKKSAWNLGTTPGQLADMLNQFAPTGSLEYVAFVEADADDAIAHLKSCVDRASGTRYPGVALIDGGVHWEVVHGFREPKEARNSIHLRNPLPERNGLQPPLIVAHTDGDECDLQNQLSPGGAPDDEAMTISDWKADFFGVCTFPTPAEYHGKFVVVAPNVPPPHLRLKTEPDLKITKVVSGTQAAGFAFDGIVKSGLLDEADWRDALSDVRMDELQPSVLVQRVNRPGAFYLVALKNGRAGGMLVGVDADTGEFLFSRLNPGARIVDSALQPIDEVAAAFDPAKAFKTRVVWAPVKNTFYSPYFPLVEFADLSGPKFYVRLFDRKRIDNLHKYV